MTENRKALLLIEDEVDIRTIYQEALKNAGFEVDIATDGEEALHKARKGGYALILLDLMIPKIDGLEFLSALKKGPPQKKNGPVILLTNIAKETIIKKGLKLGAKGYLIKTDFNPTQLADKIKEFIK